MYVFATTRTVDFGRSKDAMEGAVELTAKVNEETDLSASTWFQQYAPTGSAIMWTARLEHLEDYDRGMELIRASDVLQDAMAELDESFTGPATDQVIEVLAGNMPSTPLPVVTMVQATACTGHLRAAVHWGSDVAERVGSAMGKPTIFARGLYGHYGSLFWATYFEDMNAVEGSNAKMATDEMLQAVIDEGAHNCEPGAIATVMRKLD